MTSRKGFALIAAMWLVVLLGVGAWGLSLASRARRLSAANTLEIAAARAAAEAGLATAQSALQDSLAAQERRTKSGTDDPWSAFTMRLPDTLSLGDERVSVSFHDPGARLHLNRASEEDLRRFLSALPMDAAEADRLAQRIADWRDHDNNVRARGAERDEYLRFGARRLPANTDFGSLDELRFVDGVTPALVARIAPFLTLSGVGQVNLNAAPAAVLYSLPGFGDEAVNATLRLRQEHRVIHALTDVTHELSHSAAAAIAAVTPELSARLIFETSEMVVDAVGWLDGSPLRVRMQLVATRSGGTLLVQGRRVQVD
jgi:general secretion pathway protein K